MGTIRTLLALAVVFGHAGTYLFTGGMLAVQLFYVVSGYLMSLILLSNSYRSKTTFYINRLLRLFPIYWFVAIFTLAIYFCFPTENSKNFFNTFESLEFDSIWLYLSNIMLIGQDWIMFTGVKDGIFGFATNFNDSEVLVWQGLLVPQAWTLGVELSFYLIAPFILNNPRIWISILLLSLALRFYFISIGLGTEDPFTYRFFPLEIALFLLGAFSHQMLRPFYLKIKVMDNIRMIKNITYLFIFFICIFHLLPGGILKSFMMIIVFIFALPFLAKYQSNNNADNWVGNLSYPIYICHWIVIDLIKFVFEYLNIASNSILFYFTVIALTLLFAFLLETTINQRVELTRMRYKK